MFLPIHTEKKREKKTEEKRRDRREKRKKKRKRERKRRVLGIFSFRNLFCSFHADRLHNKSLPQITLLRGAKNDLMLKDLLHIYALTSYHSINFWKRQRLKAESSQVCVCFCVLNNGTLKVDSLDWNHIKCSTVPSWHSKTDYY